MDHLVLTVLAADKAGQVERIAQCIADHGGNWLESRMARMAGQFAGILRVAVPPERYADLILALQGLDQAGIRVQVAESGAQPEGQWRPVILELTGNDRPGIVRDITRVLAAAGVNLEKLSTDVQPAPMSGEPLFSAQAHLAVPVAITLEDLQARLEGLADELMVDLALRSDG
ncbi:MULTISPECIES: glycine cleavage system protein R [unclassified Pseudomonas]|uniref:glycine cleavage system protein R n=1 Tax=unclassified Pseudomonas TaxID=196821 RepID=UPI000BD1BEB4|nr:MULTISPECIES: ACT domain-containing protein [unclassified Pseudomonas]PVZ15680.1 glycine cleavage system regulatory protein [Pseudomonas sp. URIL14HWK12:I12]PVZ25054.1 glycine cleavage system regulatory protein [Pseudomonas sp. URIL14HWK12:I10]PVZ34900.1 glycine cleavage system regulatory protein [Pseudomonas sp. URIL14HWK12:I11]SNZ09607.1 ACT domain protein [Pseudomonas sp. URIL14HWK12:I9]